jgi:hypothetical protein
VVWWGTPLSIFTTLIFEGPNQFFFFFSFPNLASKFIYCELSSPTSILPQIRYLEQSGHLYRTSVRIYKTYNTKSDKFRSFCQFWPRTNGLSYRIGILATQILFLTIILSIFFSCLCIFSGCDMVGKICGGKKKVLLGCRALVKQLATVARVMNQTLFYLLYNFFKKPRIRFTRIIPIKIDEKK